MPCTDWVRKCGKKSPVYPQMLPRCLTSNHTPSHNWTFSWTSDSTTSNHPHPPPPEWDLLTDSQIWLPQITPLPTYPWLRTYFWISDSITSNHPPTHLLQTWLSLVTPFLTHTELELMKNFNIVETSLYSLYTRRCTCHSLLWSKSAIHI